MLLSQGLKLILLLATLLWTGNNGISGETSNSSLPSSSNSTRRPSMLSNASSYTTVTTDVTPTVLFASPTVHSATKSAATERNIQNTTSISTHYNSLSQTTHQSILSTKDVESNPTTSINRASPPSGLPTTSNGLPTVSESYGVTTNATPTEMTSNNFTTATYNGSFATMAPTNETELDSITSSPTNNLSSTSTTSLTTKNNTIMTDLWTSAQTPSLRPNFTGGSAESREPQKEHHNNGGVVFGAIVGAVLGLALIGLVGYFMCGKRKSESFAHQRLYDDTRNDPVLRLDNAPEPYGASFGDLSYYNPTTTNMTHDAIPMDDMTSSQPSA